MGPDEPLLTQLQRHGHMIFRPYPTGVGTTVILCGAEVKIFRRMMIDHGVKACLLSYYYLRDVLAEGKDKIEVIQQDLLNFDYVYVDSGGYTLQQAVDRGDLNVSLHEYIDEYYGFAEKMRNYVTVFGAVDSVSVAHGFTANDMDDRVHEAYDRGIHVAPTVFPHDDLEGIRRSGYLGKFDLIGLSGGANKESRNKAIRVFGLLKRSGVRVHGYAMTARDDFRYFRFFSVDSLTWLGGMRFGSTYIFNNGRIKTFNLKYKDRIRPQLVAVCKEFGIDFDEVMQDKWRAINQVNLVAWHKLSEHHRMSISRAYWIAEEPMLVNEQGDYMGQEDTSELLSALSSHSLQAPAVDQPGSVMEAEVVPADDDYDDVRDLTDVSPGATALAVQRTLPMQCDTCYLQDKGCPKAAPGADCSIKFAELFEVSTRNVAIKESAYQVLELQFERVMRGAFIEKANEGVLDSNLSHEITRYFNLLAATKSLQAKTSSLSISASGDAASQAAGQGGILSQLLGISKNG